MKYILAQKRLCVANVVWVIFPALNDNRPRVSNLFLKSTKRENPYCKEELTELPKRPSDSKLMSYDRHALELFKKK
jgi:hypothetical protein